MSLSSTIFVNESAYFFTPNILSSDVLNMTFALSRTLFWKKENNTIHWQLSLLKNVSFSWLTGRKGLMFVTGKKEDCTQWVNTIHVPSRLFTSSFCQQSYICCTIYYYCCSCKWLLFFPLLYIYLVFNFKWKFKCKFILFTLIQKYMNTIIVVCYTEYYRRRVHKGPKEQSFWVDHYHSAVTDGRQFHLQN